LAEIRIGTSGWHYDHWVGPLYPAGTRSRDFLGFYAERFAAAEINNTFYSLPKPATLEGWRDATPAGFVFTAKASRYLTHMKKLNDAGDGLARFLDTVAALDPKLGPLLFQLPPRWKVNVARLEAFLAAMPKDRPAAFEFRDPSWWIDDVYAALERHGAAFCPFDLAGDAALAGWARRLGQWRDEGRDVWLFFDNDAESHAVQDAMRLRRMVDDAA